MNVNQERILGLKDVCPDVFEQDNMFLSIYLCIGKAPSNHIPIYTCSNKKQLTSRFDLSAHCHKTAEPENSSNGYGTDTDKAKPTIFIWL